MDFEKDIVIDSDALDVEWLNQPALAMQYGKWYAECFRTLQEAEEHIKLVRSQLVKRANDDPAGVLGKDVKPTVVNVESYYRQHEDHIDAKKEIVEAQYQLNIAMAAKNEIGHSRKTALENLVKLHGHNYFAGPTMPRDLSYENEQAQEQKRADTGVAKRLKRRKSNG